MSVNLELRPATRDDQDGIIALIDDVFREYGTAVDLGGSEANLLDITKHYLRPGGQFWVLVDADNTVLGSHSSLPLGSPHQSTSDNLKVCTLKRLYLDAKLRGSKWGHELMQVAIDWARESGFERIEFWSDTRFERAHRFFAKFGFVANGEVRTMHDSHEVYQELFFTLDLRQE